MLEALSYTFMQNALAAGLLASIACGVVGSLVVVNRMVFLAGAVAHAAYGGVGLAFLAGWPVLPTALGFTTAASLGMAQATWKQSERTDAVVGALWAVGMASGIICIDLAPGYNTDLMSYLFGSILTVPRSELWIMLVLDAALLGFTAWFYQDLLALSFDPEFARARGVPVRLLHFLLPAMVAVSVVMVVQVVGLILVIALMSIPPFLAERRARSLAGMMVRAAIFSAVFCTAGLALSYWLDLTSGASIIAVAALGFFADQGLARVLTRGGRRA